MPKPKPPAQTNKQILVQLFVKQLSGLDDVVIPLLRESGKKYQRSEVIRVLLDIVIDATPYIDRAALANGESLEEIVLEGIVKAAKNKNKTQRWFTVLNMRSYIVRIKYFSQLNKY